jgi:hypothetical protein
VGARHRGHQRQLSNAQAAIVKVSLKPEREQFLRVFVYGSGGNDARHGEEADRDELALMSLVGFLCWIEEFTGEPALRWFGGRLDRAILKPSEPVSE